MGQKFKKNKNGSSRMGRSKNKLPVLEPDHDFYKTFQVEAAGEIIRDIQALPVESDSDDFSQLLESSLKGKSPGRILQEKQNKPPPGPLPFHKRIKRYPPPECELDLHGYHALGAQIYADSFIRTCQQQGIFTLRIIVGKGLHSEFQAVLPDTVADLLTKMKKEGIVFHFEWEKRKKIQSGAIIVYLKQFND